MFIWVPWLNLLIGRVGSQLWKEKIHQLFLFKCFPTPPSFIYHFCQGSYQYFSLWNWMMKIPFKVTYAKVISSMCGETTQPNMAKRLDLRHCKNKISLELHFLVAFEKHFLEVDYLGQSKILKACFHSIIDLGRNWY